jgi:hypothetical protein
MQWARAVTGLVIVVTALVTTSAAAHVNEGGYRLWIDADLFSVGGVRTDPGGGAPIGKTTVIGVGPNQLGNSRPVIPLTPLGVGFAYVLRPKWLLGARAGFGYDRVEPKGGDDAHYVSFSLMPELTFVPVGHDAKLFVKFSPVMQYSLEKSGPNKSNIFMGCFSLGVGTFVFTSHTSSVDIGAYFEGRFGNLKREPGGQNIDVDDYRGVIRAGVSLWR